MQYHASLITADGAYHCPVGSIMTIFLFEPKTDDSINYFILRLWEILVQTEADDGWSIRSKLKFISYWKVIKSHQIFLYQQSLFSLKLLRLGKFNKSFPIVTSSTFLPQISQNNISNAAQCIAYKYHDTTSLEPRNTNMTQIIWVFF